ncbi:hypothetical protein Pan44_39280 [Caulifigura coniformis]|uniref:Uncharacterized protein n=1 Tax=Caulifigura coniformis TaxID=2527983 RepID=A0A517SIC7_9PLAN|nr:hypothetical protein Pan44_39280 [Caulifigura coniformis]
MTDLAAQDARRSISRTNSRDAIPHIELEPLDGKRSNETVNRTSLFWNPINSVGEAAKCFGLKANSNGARLVE